MLSFDCINNRQISTHNWVFNFVNKMRVIQFEIYLIKSKHKTKLLFGRTEIRNSKYIGNSGNVIVTWQIASNFNNQVVG